MLPVTIHGYLRSFQHDFQISTDFTKLKNRWLNTKIHNQSTHKQVEKEEKSLRQGFWAKPKDPSQTLSCFGWNPPRMISSKLCYAIPESRSLERDEMKLDPRILEVYERSPRECVPWERTGGRERSIQVKGKKEWHTFPGVLIL